jgi:D-aminopeptidase
MRKTRLLRGLVTGAVAICSVPNTFAQDATRARDLGIPFDGETGPNNAITDVAGVEVGHVTLIRGDGALKIGEGPVRTGVTVVLPRGRKSVDFVYGGFFNLNGNGEMTGQSYLEDFGVVSGPIGITNTHAIGEVYAGIMHWSQRTFGKTITPVVGETWDGYLHDLAGFYVKPENAVQAIEAARNGQVVEGNVGGGTGMVCFGFKGGIGTSSRKVKIGARGFTVGVLVQCNTGDRKVLRIAGAPVGQDFSKKWLPCYVPRLAPPEKNPVCSGSSNAGTAPRDQGSIIIVIATDAPLIPSQLNRMARRAALGVGRMGSYAGNESGDLIVSFTTAGIPNDAEQSNPSPIAQIANADIDPLFEAVVQATEESITNALVSARDMTGADGYKYFAIPHRELQDSLRRYGRLNGSR